MKRLRYSPLHVTEFCGEMQGKFKVGLARLIKRKLHGRLEIRNLSSHVEKYFTRSLRSLVKYFSTLEDKFRISALPCNILYLFLVSEWMHEYR